MSSIEERVKKIVAEQLGVKEEEVQTEAPDEEAEKITTVALAIAYINSNLA